MSDRAQPYCVVVGGLNIDIQAFCRASYVMRDSNPGHVRRGVGGVGRNIAENLVRLGLHTEMITVLGDSSGWKRVIAHVEQTGIGLGHSPHFPGVPLPTYLCILERDGELVGAVADMRAIEHLMLGHLEERRSLLDGAAAIIVDGNIPQACIEWVAARYGVNRDEGRAATRRPLLVADPVSSAKARKFARCFGAFDIAKPNMVEAAVIAGVERDTSLSDIISALRSASNLPRELYVSMGAQGITAIEDDSPVSIPLPPPDLRPRSKNHSGAGDAACAALVWISIHERSVTRKRENCAGCESNTLGLWPRHKAKIALAAALYAASSVYPVNRNLSRDRLCKIVVSCYPELADVVDVIQRGAQT